MLTKTKVEKMKREAKAMRKDQGKPLHQALDLVAQRAGFHHWKHVTEAAKNMPVPVPPNGTWSHSISGDGSGQGCPPVDGMVERCAPGVGGVEA